MTVIYQKQDFCSTGVLSLHFIVHTLCSACEWCSEFHVRTQLIAQPNVKQEYVGHEVIPINIFMKNR